MTSSLTKTIETELKKAIENQAGKITSSNYNTVFTIREIGRGEFKFTVKKCSVCLRPHPAHDDPWSATWSRNTDAITLNTSYEMIEAFNEAKAFKHIAQWIVPASTETVTNSRTDKEGKFPLWDASTNWDQYKEQIALYKVASSKKPVNQFLDLINALRTADRTAISNRVTSKFKDNKTDPDILDKAVQWLEENYGATPIERQSAACRNLKTLSRKDDEGITDYITRFEEMCEQCNEVGLSLPDKLEATLLQLGANLNTQDTNNIASSVDMSSNEPGLTTRMKFALRKVAIKRDLKEEKTEVLLTDYDGTEEEAVMTEEVVLYGEASGYNNYPLGFQTAPQTAYQTGNRRFQRFRRGGQGGFQPRGGSSAFFPTGGQRQQTPF